MTVRLLIKHPLPVHAEESGLAHRLEIPIAAPAWGHGHRNRVELDVNAKVALPRFYATDVIHPSIDKLKATFKNALAQAVSIGFHGAVTFIVVNDNG